MAKKKKNYNPNLIKARRSYTIKEIAEVYGRHSQTVQRWLKQGLKPIEGISNPYLIMGEEVRRFLKERRLKRKYSLKPGEFFCPKCHSPRKSLYNRHSIEATGRMLGKHRQLIIKGVCEVCGHRLLLFSSDRKVQELKEKGLLILEQETALTGRGYSSINAYIGEGGKDDKG